MARCYYLDYISKGFLSSYSNDEYVCKLCGKRFAINDPQVKYTCNPDYGEEYKKCPVYQNNRDITNKNGGAEAPPFSLLFAYSPLRSYTARTYFRPRQMVARHTAMENPPHRDTHSR